MTRLACAVLAAALFAGALVLGAPAGAQDLSTWLKERQARFAAYQAAHPNPEAEIAEIKTKTAAMIAAYVPPPTPAKYADLRARSQALSPEQRAQALAIFQAAFRLWQGGDFAAAKEGFQQGLAIDPANGMANFYMGDILQRENNAAEAALFMDRSVTLAPGTAEAFKATAALRSLPDPALNQPPVIWRTSDAPSELWDGADYPEMMVVPAGEYTMGSPDTEAGHKPNESPRHRVRIGYALAVSKYPITVGEFAQFVAETRYDAGDRCYTDDGGERKERDGRNWRRLGFAQDAMSPAVCLNWNDAKAYATWLSQKTGHAYRLLSEAEYEYATRAGTTTAYWWGDDIGTNRADCDGCGSAWDNKQAPPVGSFAANPFGLYDTTGNVWTWISDCWNDTYSGAPADGSSNQGGDCSGRPIRGGSRHLHPQDLRAARRSRGLPSIRDSYIGFRLARTL